MRDLTRRNANVMAHHLLREAGLEVFTPMQQIIMTVRGRKQRRDVPVIQDLLFVHESKEVLDSYVARYPNLQYRYCHGHTINADMERFIYAVGNSDNARYYMPGELTKAMYGRRVRIVGGVFDDFEGNLLSVKGMRTRRLIVEIPGLMAASVEVNPDFIQLV